MCGWDDGQHGKLAAAINTNMSWAFEHGARSQLTPDKKKGSHFNFSKNASKKLQC